MNESNSTFDENLDLAKSLTASVWERLENLGVAKGGPGSGPHKGGGNGGAQPSGEHLTRAHTHDEAAAFHDKQSEMLRTAQNNLKAAGLNKAAEALNSHITAHNNAAAAHDLAAQDQYSAAWGGSKAIAERTTNEANARSSLASGLRDQSNNS